MFPMSYNLGEKTLSWKKPCCEQEDISLTTKDWWHKGREGRNRDLELHNRDGMVYSIYVFEEVSSFHQGFIYLSKYKVKTAILWNIFIIIII